MEKTREVLTEEQLKLIEDNLPFCYYWFNLYQVYNEDIQQALLLKLCDSIQSFDPNKGTITTFIGMTFQYEFYNRLSAEKKESLDAISLDSPVYLSDDGDEITIADAFPVTETGFGQIEAQMLLNNICKNIKEDASISEDRVKLFFAWIANKDFAVCGKLLNIPAHRAEFLIKETYKTIRKHHLEEMEIDPKYKRYTLSEIKDRFFAINKSGAPAERAVVVLSKSAMRNRTKDNRSYIISSDLPFFKGESLEDSNYKLEGTKLKDKNGEIYLLNKYIKDEHNDIEVCYLLN